ncbi:MAG: heavy metal-responsive transcriptional regulator [Armatimonadota bacterium]|nr:heavy metal-responsive transcriptional regulator [Armatimonadota bacterium]MDR7421822.1 heavy metal-responsive transcriptional regulator [Armatimonadota bacterium]MDR7457005.1 heavy metal-responsive transcriptional regulator [Armatimonadota bacterium]MDR7497542.1 heavy metal-responsive transcriptional regulator [Armatimonadota bacterium]MDR7511114.1 heavy metal-responsive transcriptional regulator [Armatimonadota bacterium]
MTLRIGELAARAGLSPKTIRYYESLGLLPPPPRTPAGYRLYGSADEERLAFIARAKALGLSLAEIREVLDLHDAGTPPCDRVVAVLDRKLAMLDAQMRSLAARREALIALRRRAPARVGADGCICGIIELGVSAG